MIRLYCIDGPFYGQTHERPLADGANCVYATAPPYEGFYFASKYDMDSDGRWRARWIPPRSRYEMATATLSGVAG